MEIYIRTKCVYICAEIEMVVMEKCKVPELTEQNITDEEKTAAATRTHAQRSRYVHAHSHMSTLECITDLKVERRTKGEDGSICGLILCSLYYLFLAPYRPFLDMVYSALDCTSDDYHALFVLCLLYAVSHSKGMQKLIVNLIYPQCFQHFHMPTCVDFRC